MQLDRLFSKECYGDERHFNHSFCGSILDVLKLTQHVYNRKDVAKAYRFIAEVIEKGPFPWPGKKPLQPKAKFAKIVTKEDDLEPIA